MSSKRLLWWLIAGTRGGTNRARIIYALHNRPYNANQIAELLSLDYKTVRHHLDLLMKHGVLVSGGEDYGKLYFLSHDMEANFDVFQEIWVKIGQSDNNQEEDD